MKKRYLSCILILLILIQGCALNQYQLAKINNNNYLVNFDIGIPKEIQTRINSALKLRAGSTSDKTITIDITNYKSSQYDVYSGNSLRSLEKEIKSSLKITINLDKTVINKSLMSMKRYSSIELNPLAEKEMLNFIKNEIFDDLYNQIILEVSLIDL
ncbi:MAG: hypothetical protein CBD86_02945 [Gammaproteobacteria bacterium TMED226]|nr:MAG: hypothetical protein CBD86_02945 [Gammaproteobacteria bacterium TMED226]|tara:strand:- start:10041 stop:10511 length:471 start_codon:yes stop_codon:yes gene_type:complete